MLDPGTDDDSPVAWSVALTNASQQQPYVDRDLAVFTLLDRRVVARRAGNGEAVWTTQLPGPVPGGFFDAVPHLGTILGWRDLILVSGWDLFALDRATGAIRWTFAHPDLWTATSGIALADDAVISTGGGEGYLYSVDAATGTLRWRADLDERPFSPIVADGVVYVGGSGVVDEHGGLGVGHLWAVNAATGAVLWGSWVGDSANTFNGGVVGPAAVAGGVVVVAGYTGGDVVGFDRASGATRWARRFDHSGFSAGVAVVGSVAVVADWMGRIRALDPSSGVVQWEANLGSVVERRLTTGAEMVFVNPAIVYAFTPDGREAWRYGGRSVELYFSTPAVFYDGMIYVAANNVRIGATGGGLYALRVGK